ncbi:MAG: ATP-binding protein [Deltaproteobacteria bacterium]
MMPILGLILAYYLYRHFNRRVGRYRRRYELDEGDARWSEGAAHWHEEWDRRWASKTRRRVDKRNRRRRRKAPARDSEEAILARAKKRARAEMGFYNHLTSYLAVMSGLAIVNLLTTHYPWFIWPALGWGIGVFSHYMAVYGRRALHDRYWEPAVNREVRRETVQVRTEKQASIDELSASIAHEIRNPVAAARSLVQQMGEDPRSIENVEYAQVALEELGRVEKSISHLLKFAKEEDIELDQVRVADIVDAALTEMRGKLDEAKVVVQRNYIGGPTIIADKEKLRAVFANIFDNAIDSFSDTSRKESDRKIELYIENGVPGRVRVRVRDNGEGIKPGEIDRIFNPFFTTKATGTGLGMAISKKVVEAHDGSIDVSSKRGEGTEFVVALPLPERTEAA